MGDVFLASYLIGLREGLEMVLIISVLVAYLVKTGRRRQLPPMWAGVAAAAALSIGFGWLLSYVSSTVLGGPEQELFDAITSTVAVALVTWMVFWMRRTARRLSGELRGKLDDAVGLGIGAVVGIAFLAVVREGLETTLLFFASAQGATTSSPLLGLLAGLATAVVLGVALYAGAVRINLSAFFTVSGALLVLVAAGIFKYAVHDFQEAGVLPGLTTTAFDISGTLDPSSWYGAVIAGVLNITPAPTVLEMVAYVAYLVPVLALFLLPGRTARRTATPATATPATPTTTTESSPHVDAPA
ncbi:iron transporter [Modestobacter sp. I12A-02628]|uniref:Iron transporter n=1 Tax=Goekera deserti TaxID=2497753 RepID=A0A7K3WH42_9ACTN|nr:iron uptake transporter permease EfeU [Goekera deserti]MPR00068.1 iron transporter [Goekera deserti]NDI49847.1 iron transporter [Goekera deserti]NEL55209.1 iron transporter [Goekera deserti]